MSIPMPMLWRANLEIKRKISLILVFGGGVFVMMAGILRCALIIKVRVHHFPFSSPAFTTSVHDCHNSILPSFHLSATGPS